MKEFLIDAVTLVLLTIADVVCTISLRSNSPLDVLGVARVVALGLLVAVVQDGHRRHEVQELARREDPQVPPRIRPSVTVTDRLSRIQLENIHYRRTA